MQANNPEVHNLVADTGYPAVSNIPPPPQHMYGQDEGITTDKAAYYDRQAIAETNAYSGHSYPSTPAAHETQHPQQQGYEMHQRSAV